MSHEKRCSHCKAMKALHEFAYFCVRDNIRFHRCRACTRAAQRATRESMPWLHRASDVRHEIKKQLLHIEGLRRAIAALDAAPRGVAFFLPTHLANPQDKLKTAEERLRVLRERLEVYEQMRTAHERGERFDFNQIAPSVGVQPR